MVFDVLEKFVIIPSWVKIYFMEERYLKLPIENNINDLQGMKTSFYTSCSFVNKTLILRGQFKFLLDILK